MIRYAIALLALAGPVFAACPTPGSNSKNATILADITDTGDHTVFVSPGTNARYDIYSATVTNSDGSVGTNYTISCGATVNEKISLYAGALGGVSEFAGSPLRCAKNTAITITAETNSAQLRYHVTACVGSD